MTIPGCPWAHRGPEPGYFSEVMCTSQTQQWLSHNVSILGLHPARSWPWSQGLLGPGAPRVEAPRASLAVTSKKLIINKSVRQTLFLLPPPLKSGSQMKRETVHKERLQGDPEEQQPSAKTGGRHSALIGGLGWLSLFI